jgi:tetratricopeptide (TPR) repeat protein
MRGNASLGREYAANAFQEAEKIHDIELMVPIGLILYSSYTLAGEFLKVANLAPRIIDLLESTQRQSEDFGRGLNAYSQYLAYYGYSLGWLGNFEEGEAIFEKCLRFALEINDTIALCFAEYYYGFLLTLRGDGRNSIEHVQKAIRYAEEIQFVVILGPLWTMLGMGYYFLGDLDTARKHMEKGLQIYRDAGFSAQLSIFYWIQSVVHLDSGDLDNARSYVEEALELSQKNNEKHAEGMSWLLLGRILGKKDMAQSSKAEEYILQGIHILDELEIKTYSSTGYFYLGELYADTGQREKALETLKKAESEFQAMGMDYWLRGTQEVLERVEGKTK